MNKIDIFLIKNETGSVANTEDSRLITQELLAKQCEQNNLLYNIKFLSLSELPTNSNSDAVSVFLENSSVPKNYIKNLLCLQALYADWSILCGDILTLIPEIRNDKFSSEISKYAFNYKLSKYSKNLVCDITSDFDNFPPSYNISIASRAYNEAGGISPIVSPRGAINNDRGFLLSCSNVGRIIHSDSLSTSLSLSQQEFTIESLCKYFYELGFMASLNIKFKKAPHFEIIWKQFVETPESLDHRVLGRLTFALNGSSDENKIFAEKIAMIKCSYQSGLFEGLSGVKVL